MIIFSMIIIKQFSIILLQNAEINLADSNGDTAIHWAAREGHSHIVRLLYEHGADVDRQNKVNLVVITTNYNN